MLYRLRHGRLSVRASLRPGSAGAEAMAFDYGQCKEGENLMNVLELGKPLLPPIVYDALFMVGQRRALRKWLCGACDEWGYAIYKLQLIEHSLSNEDLLQRFRHGHCLPSGYGVRVDERCVEYPWIMTNLRDGPEMLLDAGSTLNHDEVLQCQNVLDKTIHIVTLEPEDNCYWKKRVSYVFCDLRQMPIKDAFYDTIVCCSVLEHIGLDNTIFTCSERYRENAPGDFVLVMQEFRRVLKPGGILLLTVPFGVYHHGGWYQQFDRRLLDRAVGAFGPASTVEEHFYRYHHDGWNVAKTEDCEKCKYQDQQHPFRANAVACVRIVK